MTDRPARPTRRGRRPRRGVLVALVLVGLILPSASAQELTPADVQKTLIKVVRFADEKVSRNGGYVYLTSSDLKLREAEGIPGPDTVWVQPPGTPAVGAALLRAYQATGDEQIRQGDQRAANEQVARALVREMKWYDDYLEMGGVDRSETLLVLAPLAVRRWLSFAARAPRCPRRASASRSRSLSTPKVSCAAASLASCSCSI